jgi:translin
LRNLKSIAERLLANMTEKSRVRDEALLSSRKLIRYCADAIRAVHRDEKEQALELIASARESAAEMKAKMAEHPDLYYAGYTQDALKEYAEACITYAVVQRQDLPEPEAIGVETSAYFRGLAEAAGELRRRALDIIRHGELEECERILDAMEEIYAVLVTVDFPDAITGGLRHTTDMVRGVLEKTRGDLTMAMRQETLQEALQRLEARVK